MNGTAEAFEIQKGNKKAEIVVKSYSPHELIISLPNTKDGDMVDLKITLEQHFGRTDNPEDDVYILVVENVYTGDEQRYDI